MPNQSLDWELPEQEDRLTINDPVDDLEREELAGQTPRQERTAMGLMIDPFEHDCEACE